MEEILSLYEPAPESELALKSCPFCGNTQILYEEYRHTAGVRWRVWCTACLAGIDNGYAQQKHQIQALWNKRTNAETV